jgi:hypothetical protein
MTQTTTVSQWMMIGIHKQRDTTYEMLHVNPSAATINKKLGFKNIFAAVLLIVRALRGCHRTNADVLTIMYMAILFRP